MKEIRKKSDYYQKIAEELIEKHPLLVHLKAAKQGAGLKIIYLESDREKQSKLGPTYADCEKVSASKRWAIDSDFIITVYIPNVARLTEEQKKLLMLHELMHIGIKYDKQGELTPFIVPHSVQDFRYILEKYGLDWDQNPQLTFNFDA